MPPQSGPEILMAQKFFQVMKGCTVLALFPETIAQPQTLPESKLRRGKANEQPAYKVSLRPVFAQRLGIQCVMQAFPVAGAKTAQAAARMSILGK